MANKEESDEQKPQIIIPTEGEPETIYEIVVNKDVPSNPSGEQESGEKASKLPPAPYPTSYSVILFEKLGLNSFLKKKKK